MEFWAMWVEAIVHGLRDETRRDKDRPFRIFIILMGVLIITTYTWVGIVQLLN